MGKGRRIDEYLGGGRRPGEDRAGDCDKIIAERAAELAAEKVAARFLSRIVDEIEAMRREVESLRAEVERLSNQIQSSGARARLGQRGRGRSALADFLAKEGFILGSEAKAKLGVGPLRLKAEAEEVEAVVIEMEGDIAVMDRRAYEEFVALLASVKTSDPLEAARQMGKFERLFTELRRSGRVYFDARRSMWRIL